MQMLLVFFLFSKFSFFELRLANFSRFLNGNFPENAPRFLLFSKRDMPADDTASSNSLALNGQKHSARLKNMAPVQPNDYTFDFFPSIWQVGRS